jgi:CelD/BcsL family acetyltransferase involved in cellulose biosynthesis
VYGQRCASQHVLKYRSRAFKQGTGYDLAFRRYGVGYYIQQLGVLEELCDSQGVIEFDLGHGDDQYKRELCRDYRVEAGLVVFRISLGD